MWRSPRLSGVAPPPAPEPLERTGGSSPGRGGRADVRERGLGHVCPGPLISPAPYPGCFFFWDLLGTQSSLVTGENQEMLAQAGK